MTPELKEKIDNLVEILYQYEYIDGVLYNRGKIDWTDKGEAFMKEKFGQLWSTSWPNFSQPEKFWLPHISLRNAMRDAFNTNVRRNSRDYWDYSYFDRWNEGDDKKLDLYIELLQLESVDYIELDDLLL